MKKNFLLVKLSLFALLFVSTNANAQQTACEKQAHKGTSSLESYGQTKQNLWIPRLTTSQRGFGGENLIVFNTDTHCVEYWGGTSWISLCECHNMMALSPEPCQDVRFNSTGCEHVFRAIDPDCADGPFEFAVVAGSDFAYLSMVNENRGEFQIAFQQNNHSINSRSAVVRITNKCTDLFKDFLFTQHGRVCSCMLTNVYDTRWVRLCEASSAMTVYPHPCRDVDVDGMSCEYVFEITDFDCADGPFEFAIVSGSDFAYLSMKNEAEGKFQIVFYTNDYQNPRSAVVRVTNYCTGLFREFLFTQEGQTNNR